MDPAEGDEMSQPPVAMGEAIITRLMLSRIASMALSIGAVTLGFFVFRLSTGTPFSHAQTETFTLLAVCEWFNVLNCRSETHSALTRDVFRNRPLVIGIALSMGLQFAVVYVPALNETFRTVPLPFSDVVLLGALGSIVLWVEEARKLWKRRRGRGAP
jgi:magnesium-transporting ATPase (P-type)